MLWLLIGVIILLLLSFAVVLLFGAPYLPTLTPQVRIALELADLKPGQTLLELGCGDGKVLIAAARQGIHTVGYELNPLLALIAWLRTRRYRSLVRVVWGNFWTKKWPPADAIFTFLLDRYMMRLDEKIVLYSSKPLKLVSFAFRITNRQPVKTVGGVYLYYYDHAEVATT